MTESARTVPISGRISVEDYDFLMSHPFGGKVTASEKLRHMASTFRRYHEHLGEYAGCLEELERLMAPARKNLKRLENETETRSEVIDTAMNLLPQALALLISRQERPPEKDGLPFLLETEEKVLQAVLRLVEQILRLGLTRDAPAYNPRLLDDRLGTIIELAGLLSRKNTTTPESP
ncbi:MAG: hypothetical protein ACLFRP_00225 [Puniceicoccaceae bacterium]